MVSNITKNARQPPWGQDGDKEPVGFGPWLRRQREMREVPLREVADVTKISLRYLEALEQERFDILPAPVFAKGFLREYSRYVGLDSDEVVNSFLIATGEIVERDNGEPGSSEEPTQERRRALVFVSLAVVAIVAVVLAVAWFSRVRTEQPIQSSSIAAPVAPSVESGEVSEEPAAAEAPPSPLTVTIDFTEDCWMEALIDDERTISELRVQGESMKLEAEEKVALTLGNPSGVRIEVNGRRYDFGHAEGRVVRNLEIDLALAQSLAGGEN